MEQNNNKNSTITNSIVKLNMNYTTKEILPINWIPRTKCVLVIDDELSDSERIMFGGTSKSADLANKSSEEQKPYTIVAVGDQCSYKPGDIVLFQAGCQGHSVKIEDKFYLQLGEYEILGKFK